MHHNMIFYCCPREMKILKPGCSLKSPTHLMKTETRIQTSCNAPQTHTLSTPADLVLLLTCHSNSDALMLVCVGPKATSKSGKEMLLQSIWDKLFYFIFKTKWDPQVSST